MMSCTLRMAGNASPTQSGGPRSRAGPPAAGCVGQSRTHRRVGEFLNSTVFGPVGSFHAEQLPTEMRLSGLEVR